MLRSPLIRLEILQSPRYLLIGASTYQLFDKLLSRQNFFFFSTLDATRRCDASTNFSARNCAKGARLPNTRISDFPEQSRPRRFASGRSVTAPRDADLTYAALPLRRPCNCPSSKLFFRILFGRCEKQSSPRVASCRDFIVTTGHGNLCAPRPAAILTL